MTVPGQENFDPAAKPLAQTSGRSIKILAPEHLPDDRRFESLYRRYRGALLGYCRGCVSGAAAAEDVVQETFLRAYRYFGSLDPDRSPWPWLKTIARNVIRDRAARDARETVVVIGELSHEGGEDAAEVAMALTGAFTSLRPRHRRVLELRYVADLEPRRAAEVLGVSVPAFNQLVCRARARLKSELRRLGHGVPGVAFLPRLRQRLARWWTRAGSDGSALLSRASTEMLLQVGAGLVAILLVGGLGGGRAAQAAAPGSSSLATPRVAAEEGSAHGSAVRDGPPRVPPSPDAAVAGPASPGAGAGSGGGDGAPALAPPVAPTAEDVVVTLEEVAEAAPTEKSRPAVSLGPLPVGPPPCPAEVCEGTEPEGVPPLPEPDVPDLPVDPTKKIHL